MRPLRIGCIIICAPLASLQHLRGPETCENEAASGESRRVEGEGRGGEGREGKGRKRSEINGREKSRRGAWARLGRVGLEEERQSRGMIIVLEGVKRAGG